MNKIVTFQSAEYYELLGLGWIMVEQVSATSVMMMKEGTSFGNRGGPAETDANLNQWKPTWGGIASPGTPDPIPPPIPHTWVRLIGVTNPLGETVILYADTLHPNGAIPGGYDYFRIEVLHGAAAFWDEVFYQRWDDANMDYNTRSVTTVADAWNFLMSKALGVGTLDVFWKVDSTPHAVHYRLLYSSGPVEHLHATFTPAYAEFNAAV